MVPLFCINKCTLNTEIQLVARSSHTPHSSQHNDSTPSMRGIPVDTISQTQSLTAREGEPLSESGNGPAATKPLRLLTGSDGGSGLLGAPTAETTTRIDEMTNRAWAVAFSINVAITFLAVSLPHIPHTADISSSSAGPQKRSVYCPTARTL